MSLCFSVGSRLPTITVLLPKTAVSLICWEPSPFLTGPAQQQGWLSSRVDFIPRWASDIGKTLRLSLLQLVSSGDFSTALSTCNAHSPINWKVQAVFHGVVRRNIYTGLLLTLHPAMLNRNKCLYLTVKEKQEGKGQECYPQVSCTCSSMVNILPQSSTGTA